MPTEPRRPRLSKEEKARVDKIVAKTADKPRNARTYRTIKSSGREGSVPRERVAAAVKALIEKQKDATDKDLEIIRAATKGTSKGEAHAAALRIVDRLRRARVDLKAARSLIPGPTALPKAYERIRELESEVEQANLKGAEATENWNKTLLELQELRTKHAALTTGGVGSMVAPAEPPTDAPTPDPVLKSYGDTNAKLQEEMRLLLIALGEERTAHGQTQKELNKVRDKFLSLSAEFQVNTRDLLTALPELEKTRQRLREVAAPVVLRVVPEGEEAGSDGWLAEAIAMLERGNNAPFLTFEHPFLMELFDWLSELKDRRAAAELLAGTATPVVGDDELLRSYAASNAKLSEQRDEARAALKEATTKLNAAAYMDEVVPDGFGGKLKRYIGQGSALVCIGHLLDDNAGLIERVRAGDERYVRRSQEDTQRDELITLLQENLQQARRSLVRECEANERLESRIQKLSGWCDLWRTKARHFIAALEDIAGMPEHDQDDAHRLRHKAQTALQKQPHRLYPTATAATGTLTSELKVKLDIDTTNLERGVAAIIASLGSAMVRIMVKGVVASLSVRDELLCNFVLARAANFAKVNPDDLRLWIGFFHQSEKPAGEGSQPAPSTNATVHVHHSSTPDDAGVALDGRIREVLNRETTQHGGVIHDYAAGKGGKVPGSLAEFVASPDALIIGDGGGKNLAACKLRFPAGVAPFAGFPGKPDLAPGSGQPDGPPADGIRSDLDAGNTGGGETERPA